MVKLNFRKQKNNAKTEMTFVEHLDKLRSHIIRAIVVLLLFSVVAFLLKDLVFEKIILLPKEPEFISNRILCNFAEKVGNSVICINQNPVNIINIELAGQFKAHLMVSFVMGFIIAFPYLIFELWMFIKPALNKNELKYARGGVFWVSFLFLFGSMFGYFIILPIAINFLSNYQISQTVENAINFNSYFSSISTTTVAAGLVFEMPYMAYFFAKIGVIDTAFVKKYRKHAIVIAFIIAAILTPPDVFSQILLVIPLMFLYEISFLIVKRITKKRLKTIE